MIWRCHVWINSETIANPNRGPLFRAGMIPPVLGAGHFDWNLAIFGAFHLGYPLHQSNEPAWNHLESLNHNFTI